MKDNLDGMADRLAPNDAAGGVRVVVRHDFCATCKTVWRCAWRVPDPEVPMEPPVAICLVYHGREPC